MTKMRRESHDYWDKYPDVSSDTKEFKREIKSIDDIIVDLSDKDFSKHSLINGCIDMGVLCEKDGAADKQCNMV